jgi:uncharacterized phiE125 gp8 family phage protein
MNTYGSLTLTATSPVQTFTEPLTLSEVKAYLRIPELSTADEAIDAELTAFISAAREQAEILQGRDLVAKQWDLSLDGFFRTEIPLRDPLRTVDLFTYKDSDGATTTLIEGTGYIVDTAKHPGIVLPPYNCAWPTATLWPSSAVLVRFSTSAPAYFPPLLKPGMLMLISHWHNGKLPFEGGANAIQEYPYAVTHCLSAGGLMRT